MPSSVSGRLISGSWTVARAAVIASSVGEPVSVSVIVAFCLLRRGSPQAADDGADLRVRAALPLYGDRPAPLRAAAGELRRTGPHLRPSAGPGPLEDGAVCRCPASRLRPNVVLPPTRRRPPCRFPTAPAGRTRRSGPGSTGFSASVGLGGPVARAGSIHGDRVAAGRR